MGVNFPTTNIAGSIFLTHQCCICCIKVGKAKKPAYLKLYICMFVSKVVHLELVSNVATYAFLAAINRFMSRKGESNVIHSDHRTNFVGANNLCRQELTAALREENLSTSITNFCSTKGTLSKVKRFSPLVDGWVGEAILLSVNSILQGLLMGLVEG